MRHAVEPLIDGAGDVALARDADLGEALQAALELGKLRVACAAASRRRRLICTIRAMASAISASTARPASASRTSTGSSVTLPTWMGSRAMGEPIAQFVLLDQNRNISRDRKRWRLTASRGNLMSPAQMAIRPILTIPDPILRKKAKPIERVDADLRKLMDDMLATMYDAPGIGLAAPQIGILRRLIVMDPAKDEAPKTPVIMVNPEILERSDRDARARGGLPVDPGLHRRDRAAGQDPRRLHRPRRQASRRSSWKASGRRWSSTRSTI